MQSKFLKIGSELATTHSWTGGTYIWRKKAFGSKVSFFGVLIFEAIVFTIVSGIKFKQTSNFLISLSDELRLGYFYNTDFSLFYIQK